ncbi:B-cell receptor CD22-like [Dendropsophus ebraccatus]|uniref:B-cell receptor CD22-like n=1 Tax=Dendropsophus ebraccatus TaxID=150705 RepID=UPI00383219C2
MSAAINFFIVLLLGNAAMVNSEPNVPTLRLEPENPAYIAGESLSLRCMADMPRSITGYSFFKDAIPIANNSASNTLTIASLFITDAGVYFCSYYRQAEGIMPQSPYINLRVIEPLPAPTLSVEPQKNVFVVNQSVVIRCNVLAGQSATGIALFLNQSILYEADNFGVLTLANAQKRNSGVYSCNYRNDVLGRSVESHPSNQETLAVIDLPPTPILRYTNNVHNQSGQVEIVCEIPNPSSLIHGYHLYRNGGEIITSRQANRFVINYTLEFDGCYSCRSFVDILGEEILSPKSTEVFLTLNERNRRSCQEQDSPGAIGLSKQGVKLYGSVLIGKLLVVICILLYFGIYLLVTHIRNKNSETEDLSFHQ